MFGNLFEGPHIILIALVILILFGAKKIPEFMAGLGKGIKEFKKAASDISSDVNKSIEEKPKVENSTHKEDSKS
jgi:sec-independent protein translocase protein TatA